MTDETTPLRLVQSEQQESRPLLAEATPWSEGLLGRPAAHDHIVHFYEDEEFLLKAVAHFAASGLAAGGAIAMTLPSPAAGMKKARSPST